MIVGGLGEASLLEEVKSYDLHSGQWTIMQPLAIPRRSHSCIHHKSPSGADTVVAVGGIGHGTVRLASVEIYDVSSNTWSPGPDLPVATSHLALANVKGKIFAFGGRVGDPPVTSDLILVMREDLSGWDEHEVKIPNGGFYNAAVAVYND